MQKNDFVKKWSYNLLAPSPRYVCSIVGVCYILPV